MGTLLNLKEARDIQEIPTLSGFKIVENHMIANYYAQLRSHSTDLYDFRLIKNDGSIERLFYGMLEGEGSNIDPNTAKAEAGRELAHTLELFAESAPENASRSYKTVTAKTTNICLIATSCDNGTIIGGWYNSRHDNDISWQMLAFSLYAFSALNSTDRVLSEKALDSIPNDTRFGKYSSTLAVGVLHKTLFERSDRMRRRYERRICS